MPGTGVGSNLQPNNYILHSLSLSLDVVVCLNGGNDNDDGHTLTFTISKNDSLIDRCPDCVHLFSVRATLFKVITGEPQL